MIKPRLCLCSGATVPQGHPLLAGRELLALDAVGDDPSVHIRLHDVAHVFLQQLSPRLTDLIEIAAYVYAADCAVRRGQEWTADHSVEAWERDLHFVIPVRDAVFWSRPDVQEELREVLNFLSDDQYGFTFCGLTKDRPLQQYIELGKFKDWPFYGIERVVMFSGGLDSLAGALDSAASGKNVVLVSHRPVASQSRRQKRLFRLLIEKAPGRMVHVPVWINKAVAYGREHTQRTRSFLYAALGAVVAQSIGAKGVRFFENGTVSLNLPIAGEVVRARASRTTHPIALQKFTRLHSLITERDFIVDNPYLFKTKQDVVRIIAERSGSELIPYTCSCAHAFFQPGTQWHCGSCSQCIDRRVAILHNGMGKFDPATHYQSDVFTGPRRSGADKNIAVNYVRHAAELKQRTEEQIATEYNTELSRAVRFAPNRGEAAAQLIKMVKRHAAAVCGVLEDQLKLNATALVTKGLEPTSMLAVVCGQERFEASSKRFCKRILETLSLGLPVAFQKEKPANEVRVQEVADALLKAADEELIREFPFVRWSSSLTKPDWSVEALNLFVELKYPRQKSDVRRVTEEIAADITKYGDTSGHTLFVIYDPGHVILNEAEFSAPVVLRSNMQVGFVR
jgi:hypothetical protein